MDNSSKFAAYIKNKKIIIILILIIVAILLVIAGVYYFSRGEKPKEEAKEQPQKVDTGIDYTGVDAGNVSKGTESALKNMPSTNPLEDVANPFRDAYKNPFE